MTISIQKPSLDDYVREERMTQELCATLKEALRAHSSIVVAGGTGYGKTTLLRALRMEIAQNEPAARCLVVVLGDDTPELRHPNDWCVPVELASRFDGDGRWRGALRARINHVFVDEVRGPEEVALLQAASRGHSGAIAAIHGESEVAALLQIERLAERSIVSPVMDVLVYVRREQRGPVVRELARTKRDVCCGTGRERLVG